MQIRRWWTAPLLIACLATGSYSGAKEEEDCDRDSSSRDHGDLLAKIHQALPDIINEGADLYNRGDRAGCYQLWRGALLAYRSVLDHHSHLQKGIDEALHRAACMCCPADQAFVLRSALDRLRRETAHREQGKQMPSASREKPSASREKRPASREQPPPSRPRQPEKVEMEPEKTLWERMGGAKTVRDVVTTFMNLAQNDSRLHFFRRMPHKPTEQEMDQLKEHMVNFISSVTGGPLEYRGKNMKEVHKGMGITNAEFDAAAAALGKALKIHGVPPADIQLLMSIFGTMRGDIVQPADGKSSPKPADDSGSLIGI